METLIISLFGLNLELLQVVLLFLDAFVVVVVIVLQICSFNRTKGLIEQLTDFFPNVANLEIFPSSITKEILSSKKSLEDFINDPPTRLDSDEDSDIDLIKIKRGGGVLFKEVVDETNGYLCKNVGTSADFTLLQDICERKIETLESQISSTINVPLYYGLIGTFVGIITGVGGIVFSVNELFSSSNMSSLSSLLFGVVIAMIASSIGLVLMIRNSAFNYKTALKDCNQNKNEYYDFLRRELMPVLSNSMASSLNSLKGVLGNFIGKFGHNLDAYSNSAELLNENIEKQHLLLIEINKMNQTEMATEIARTFSSLKDASESLEVFKTYQRDLNNMMEMVNGSVSKIDGIINSFDDFGNALKVVVENQSAAKDLQTQFRVAIEKNFPTGSDAREMWRKQFDELTADASKVSCELNSQLKASTEYICDFVQNNKETFNSIGQLNEVLTSLVEYTNVQATCYKDLKQEIENLKKEQIESRTYGAKLNSDLLTAVKEMISAIKTMRN